MAEETRSSLRACAQQWSPAPGANTCHERKKYGISEDITGKLKHTRKVKKISAIKAHHTMLEQQRNPEAAQDPTHPFGLAQQWSPAPGANTCHERKKYGISEDITGKLKHTRKVKKISAIKAHHTMLAP
ncbi:hypothetical protein H920_17816 [Fukomys damarensis]|uniref:Uncharacterized protein n=1 Tax=Fukomys damarensis TaxID=885580 RepID=A0A091CTE1_FUKDA|nr:hypothetical protein H920_17816 [Fukomys damarensis]